MLKMCKVLLCLTVVLAGSLAAQSAQVVATIPFNFYVGDTQFVAGDYSVSTTYRHGAMLVLALDKPRGGVLLLGFQIANDTNILEGKSRLVFNKYSEDRIFLSTVQYQDISGLQLPISRREHEAVTANLITSKRPVTITIMAGIR